MNYVNIINTKKIYDYFYPAVELAGDCPSLLRISREIWPAGQILKRSGNSFPAIIVVQKGQAHFSSSLNTVVLEPGDICSFGPEVAHEFGALEQETEVVILVFQNLPGVVEQLENILGKSGSCLRFSKLPVHDRLLQLIEDEVQESNYNFPRVVAALVNSWMLAVKEALLLSTESNTGTMQTYRECKKFIDVNYKYMTSVAEVAENMNFSHEYMCRIFRKHGKVSPNSYFQRLRMNYALYLLESGEVKIAGIAEQFGYADEFSFAKAFKKVMGVTPGTFKRNRS